MTLEIAHPALLDLVDAETSPEQLASGFAFTEGPIWDAAAHTLTFSDIPGDCMYRWSEEKGLNPFRRPSHQANGNAYDLEGRILTCEHASSRVSRSANDGSAYEVLASHYRGKELNSPNDIVVRGDGSIYFTDPPFGRINPGVGLLRPLELDFAGVFRLDPGSGDLTLLADDFSRPNGLCFSLDERRLFVNDSAHNHIRVFDVGRDGTLVDGRLWATLSGEGPGAADGMKLDSAGHLYCTGPGGIYVFDEDATPLGRIRMPEQTANLCFGGEDLKDLYITASTSLYRLRVRIAGHARSLDRNPASTTEHAS